MDKSEEYFLSTIQLFDTVLFTKSTCPYCIKAKDLLDSKFKTYAYVEIDHRQDSKELYRAIVKHSNMTTVPVIYINKNLIGGYTELLEYMRDDN